MRIILAISDDRPNCEAIRATLPKSDLLLFENSLEDGLRRLISVVADLILVDEGKGLGLPQLKELIPVAAGTPIVVLTSQSTPEAITAYTMAGAKKCITKPFDCTELEHVINQCISNAEQLQETPALPVSGTQHQSSITQHQLALRWMSRNTSYIDDPERLLQSLLDAIIDIFDPARAGILLHNDGAVRFVRSYGIPEKVASSVQLDFTNGLMRRLESNASLVDRASSTIDVQTQKEMTALGARVAIPLLTEGRVNGVIVVGEKASGTQFSLEERELLSVMARCTASFLERAKRYKDVARQQDRLNAVLSNITAGVVTVLPDKTISMMNDSAEHILQLRASDVLGQNILKLGSAFADVVLRTLKEGKPRLRQEIRDVSINAQLGLSVTPLGPEGVVVIFSKIPGELLEAEDDIAYSPLWEYLANRVAQEIKNPMVPINTYAQLLPTKFDSTEFREEFSNVVQHSVTRINDVVESIYDFARHPRMKLRTRNLNETVQQIINAMEHELDDQKITVNIDLNDEEMNVDIDPPMFHRAAQHVIANSIDAMTDGGTLTIRTQLDNGSCALFISDTGSGIKEKDESLIFMPFYSTKENGMGLGLTMAHRILQEHNGTLKLQSKSGSGGLFVFHLPQAKTAPQQRSMPLKIQREVTPERN